MFRISVPSNHGMRPGTAQAYESVRRRNLQRHAPAAPRIRAARHAKTHGRKAKKKHKPHATKFGRKLTRPRRASTVERLPRAAKHTVRNGSKRRKRVSEGIYEDQYGLAATVKIKGKQQEVRFPPGTSLKTIQAERNRMKAAMQTRPSSERHTLAYDADRYLEQVAPFVGMRNRRQEIGVWLPRFGHFRTLSLPNHINALNAQLREWRAVRAASTVNKWRNALTNLVKILYGRRAAAELVDLDRFRPPPPEPRWVDRNHIKDVLQELRHETKTAARLTLMHWTGMRPSQMGRLKPENFRLKEEPPFVAIPRGKRGRIGTVPLTREGLAAVRMFIAVNAFGEWSCSSANRALRRAAERADRTPFTVYQIRHSFAAALRRTGTDLADIRNMYGHTNVEITEIYAPPDLGKQYEAIQRLRDSEQPEPTTPRHRRKLQLVHRQDDTK
jgi:integrase